MRVELNFRKKTKANFFFLFPIIQFLFFISIPLFIYTDEISGEINSEENNDNDNIQYIDCNIKYYLQGKCKLIFADDREKYLFKIDVFNMITNQSANDIIKEIYEKPIILKEETENYFMMELDYYYSYENITHIDFRECRSKCIFFGCDYIFQIEHFYSSYRIPVLEYFLISPNGIGFSCENETLDYYIPVKGIENDSLYVYNISSDYYNDECSQYKSKNSTDLTLYTRKNDFNQYYLSICETNCVFKDYDYETSRVICECKGRKFPLPPSTLNSGDLIYFFDNEEQISNFYLLNCYYLVSSNDDIKTNPGFYLTVIVLGFFVLFFIFFIFKGYSSLKQRIDEAIKLKYHPNKKLDSKNSKLIIIKIKNNNNNENSNSRNENLIKRRVSKKTNKNKRVSKNENKNINKKRKTNSKSLSLGSRNNIMQIRQEENEENKIKKTNYEEKMPESKEENIFIFENDYELNSLPYIEALKCDNRTFCELYTSLIKTKQLLLFSLFDYNSYNPSILKKPVFFLSFIYHYGFNAFFFTDDLMQKIYEDEGKYNPLNLVPNAVYASLVSTTFMKILMDFLLLTEKNVLNIKNQKTEEKANEEKQKVIKIICIKIIIYFFINLSFLIFLWFYLTCFNALYINTRVFLMINTIISFVMSNIYPFLFYIIPAVFRVDVLKKKKTTKKAKTKTKKQTLSDAELKDAEYVYSVSQFLQKF